MKVFKSILGKENNLRLYHNELKAQSEFYNQCKMEDKIFLLSLHSNESVSLKEIKDLIIEDELLMSIEDRDLLFEEMYENSLKY